MRGGRGNKLELHSRRSSFKGHLTCNNPHTIFIKKGDGTARPQDPKLQVGAVFLCFFFFSFLDPTQAPSPDGHAAGSFVGRCRAARQPTPRRWYPLGSGLGLPREKRHTHTKSGKKMGGRGKWNLGRHTAPTRADAR